MRTYETKQEILEACSPENGFLDNMTQFYSTVTQKWYIFETEEELSHFRAEVDASVGWHDESEPVMLLNTSIVTAHGAYQYEPCDLESGKQLIAARGYKSAIGHESTAQMLTQLLAVPVTANRIDYSQPPGGVALVFKLKRRAPEGTVLSREEIEDIGYEFGLLIRSRTELVSGNQISAAKHAANLELFGDSTAGLMIGPWDRYHNP
jgi:STIV B116-like